MQKTLTTKNVSTLPRPKSGQVEYADKTLPGFGLRVSAAGVRTFYLTYRPARGPRKGKLTRWTLGRLADDFGLGDARTMARNSKIDIRDNGADPAHDGKREEGEAANTYRAVAEQFIRQYARPRQRGWKETARVLGLRPEGEGFEVVKGSLGEKWGDTPIADITRADARKHIRKLVESGKVASARVCLSWLKTFWRWAWRQEFVETPVMDALLPEDFGITKKSRDRFYSDDETIALWNVTGENLTARERAFLKLSILLGVRAGALARMRKSELDSLENPTLWTVPTERTKTRKSREEDGRVYLIPISPLARRVLLPLLKGDGDLVFPSATRKGVAMDCGTPLAKKIRKASGVADWYHHAHRHTIATWLQNAGHDEYDRGLVLQHAGAGTVTGGYSHGYSMDRAREISEKWSDHVAGIVAPEGAELLA